MYEIVSSGKWNEEKDTWDPQVYNGLDTYIFEDLTEAVKTIFRAVDLEDNDVIDIHTSGSGMYFGIQIKKDRTDTLRSYEIRKR